MIVDCWQQMQNGSQAFLPSRGGPPRDRKMTGGKRKAEARRATGPGPREMMYGSPSFFWPSAPWGRFVTCLSGPIQPGIVNEPRHPRPGPINAGLPLVALGHW